MHTDPSPPERCSQDALHSGTTSTGFDPRRRRGFRAVVVVALAALVSMLVSSLFVVGVAGAATAESDAALDWLEAELAANGGTLPGPVSANTDWGLTADAALAFLAGGRGGDAGTDALVDSVIGGLGSFSTFDSAVPPVSGVRLAGPLAKVMLVAGTAGRDTTAVDGIDLADELTGLMQISGDQAGRFSDRNPGGGDTTNGFSQAIAILALSHRSDAVPAASVDFLLDQQCPGGGFRLFYAATASCESASAADTDATALAIQALLTQSRTPEVDEALSTATGWLVAQQKADGSYGGSGPTVAANANSTGTVAQALRATGQVAEADAAAAWVIAELQVTASEASGTPAEVELGAIAYNPASLADALSVGIAANRRDQWRRAATQAVLALDADPFGVVADRAPVEPTPPPAAPPDPAPTAPTTTAPAPPADPAAGDPAAVVPLADPTAPDTGPAPVVSGAADPGTVDPSSGGGEELAFSGATSGILALVGALVLAVGLCLVAAPVLLSSSRLERRPVRMHYRPGRR